MSGHREVRSLGVEAPGRAYIWGYDEGPPGPGQFRVETRYTGFSAGTELTFLKGTNPYLHARWDDQTGLFVAGEAQLHFPVPFLGYMEVARVTESCTQAWRPGQTFGMTYGHKTGHTGHVLHDFVLSLPDTLDPVLGIYVAQMGPICVNGLLHAAAEFHGADVRGLGDGVAGRTVVVMGAGVVGLLTALLARQHGAAALIVADPSPYRRRVAEGLRLETSDEAAVARLVKERWHHGGTDRGADLVFQCRARDASLHEALRALRPQGCVVDLAFYQGGSPALRLGEEFHHNGLSLRCAQIGRVPRGLAFDWDRRRLAAATLDLLLAEGDAIRRGMITDIVPFDDAPRFLAALAAERRDFIQVVFEVTG